MVTAAQARKNKQARESGLLSSTADTPSVRGVSVDPSQELGPYKPGEIITTHDHLVRYLKLLIEQDNTTRADDDQLPTIDDKQILEAYRQIDGNQEPDDRDLAFLDYVATIKSNRTSPLSEEQERKLRGENAMWAYAVECGQRASKELEAAVEESIEGKKIWDGGPIVIEAELVKTYGSEMNDWPIIGTRLTGKTNRKGESTDNVPSGYNRPTDWFKAEVDGEPIVVRWLQGFVEAMPHVSRLLNLRSTGQAILKKNQLATIPEPYSKYVPTESNDLRETDTPRVQGIIDDLSSDITKHVNRIGNAISFHQAKQMIKEHLADSVDFEIIGTPEEARRRRSPIQMSYTITRDNKTKWVEESKPTPLSTFIRYGKNAEKCKAVGGGLAKLIEISKAKKKPKPVEGPGAGTKAAVQKVENVDQFLNTLDVIYDYASTHESQIKERCSNQRNGAEFCYTLVQVYTTLENIMAADEKAGGLIGKRAILWNQEQLAAAAAADAVSLAQKKSKAA